MNVVISVRVLNSDLRLSQITATVADAVEKALEEVPIATEVTAVTTEREIV